MKSDKTQKPWRVCCTRHYIAVLMIDVLAATPAEAARKAKKAAQKISPDPRSTATDNHWQADKPTDIPNVGYGAGAPYDQREVLPGVFCFV